MGAGLTLTLATAAILDLATAGSLADQPRATLKGHPSPVMTLCFGQGGKTLASSDQESGIVRLWDVATGASITTIKTHSRGVVALSPDGKMVATQDGSKSWEELWLWDVATGKRVEGFGRVVTGVSTLAFTTDGKTLACGGRIGGLLLVDTATYKQRPISDLGSRKDGDVSLSFSSDGLRLASAGAEDRTIRIWDVTAGTNVATLRGHKGYVRAVALSPCGNTVASGSRDKTVRVWDVTTGKVLATLSDHQGEVHAVAYHPRGRLLASADQAGTIRLWDARTGELVSEVRGDAGAVHALAFSLDGRTLASGGEDHTVKLWEVRLGPGRKK